MNEFKQKLDETHKHCYDISWEDTALTSCRISVEAFLGEDATGLVLPALHVA